MNDTKPERLKQSSIRWADGSYDHKRTCDECGLENCEYPVHTDFYKEVVTKQTYWEWVKDNMPHNTQGGLEEYKEPDTSNPDTLQEKKV